MRESQISKLMESFENHPNNYINIARVFHFETRWKRLMRDAFVKLITYSLNPYGIS